MSQQTWAERYRHLAASLPEMAATANLTFCGMGVCIDARVSLHDIEPMLRSDDVDAAAFARVLQQRAAQGIGGELAADWPEGPTWIASHIPVSYAMGGTGPHAAWVLSTVGAPALLALEDRSPAMMRLMPPNILLARGDGLARAETVAPAGSARPEVFIFEYTAGVPVGDVVPTRSSRIIVRFADLGLEHDAAFDRVSQALAAEAGAGLVSGFSAVPPAEMERETARVFALVRDWRAAGLQTVHLELAGYDPPSLVRQVLDGARGVVTSIGMSHSEFRLFEGEAPDLGQAMMAYGNRWGVDRICVHADHWAASVTRRDPAREERALMTGCLLASARAAAGIPVVPEAPAAAATFAPLPFEPRYQMGDWSFVACASPYLTRPRTTLGLGDTFTAGCLLALGAGEGSSRAQAHSASA